MEHLHQGDILKIEKIKHPVLVVSKVFFNTSAEIIGCPIIRESIPGPLHIWMSTDVNDGVHYFRKNNDVAGTIFYLPCYSYIVCSIGFGNFSSI